MPSAVPVDTVRRILEMRYVQRMAYLAIARALPSVSEKTVYRICKGHTHSDEREAFLARVQNA
jgi:hypothetical protein